ncbi:2-hydroxy-palmitic acid dioxygenase Mpo1p [Trichomonascus vanleenenianus]|uniref:2-hydroxy-palmitic acid dioxygenase MPO1 n=1 Tax=Trichomonascus vanleenenianus TaxID=2268995 RepID=UPI003ECABA89
MGVFNLKEQLAFYRAHHKNPVNVAIHLVFVPTIQATSTLLGANLALGPQYSPYLNLGVVTAAGYGVFYSLLDWKFGLPTIPFLVWGSMKLTDLLLEHGADANKAAAALWFAAWLAQFAGHKWFEKKAPSLLDNPAQALVLAPFFVLFEIAGFLGLRKGVMKEVDAYIAEKNAKQE